MLSRIDQVLSAVCTAAWAIQPEKLQAIMAVLERRSAGVALPADELEAVLAARDARLEARHGSSDSPRSSQIAVLPVFGIISHRMGGMNDVSGGTSTERFTQDFRAAVANTNVDAIVLDIDSPGGSVPGVPELAAEVLAARQEKPVFAIANSLAASAAYWIASQATEVSVIPSGEVGAIGVFGIHIDERGAAEQLGFGWTITSAGRFKMEGHPLVEFTDEAQAVFQATVDEFYEEFVDAVARGRGAKVSAVRNGFGEGRVLRASNALAARMVDHIETRDELLIRVAGQLEGARSGSARRRASIARERLALDN